MTKFDSKLRMKSLDTVCREISYSKFIGFLISGNSMLHPPSASLQVRGLTSKPARSNTGNSVSNATLRLNSFVPFTYSSFVYTKMVTVWPIKEGFEVSISRAAFSESRVTNYLSCSGFIFLSDDLVSLIKKLE